MSFDVLIPARLASTRLPGKPLADIGGLPMIVRVARRAAQSAARSVTVAADDASIVAACTAHGIAAVLTGPHHASGSDRLAEAARLLGFSGSRIVVNVQGDEPMLDPALIDACAALLERRSDCPMSTAAHPIASAADFANPNIVKVVLDASGAALYFSRAPIPWPRDRAGALDPSSGPAPLRHVGLYAYRAEFLQRYPQLPPSPLETIEQLEQLRVLWHGERIAVHVGHGEPGIGIDTPADLEAARALFAANAGAGFA
ncbi:MAG: 3-deoxy-manno-octulosonate cytidylyltransferase [Burkholderiales bacterium]|nr:3-deoxy-manno-octulosonate cytidylyltransferase [Burkholderiales bacterium]